MTSDELVAAVLANPEVLWRLRTYRVVGPWVEAKSEKRRISHKAGSKWRCLPNGEDVAVVYTSRSIESLKPREGHYYGGYEVWDNEAGESYTPFDDERYAEDMAEWEAEKATWKPWKWRVGPSEGYADTREEAQTAADVELQRRKCLLYDGEDPKEISRALLLMEETLT